MAEVMAEKGYVSTSVADVLQRASVSRQSFYELFESKLDCFMAAFACAGEILLGRLNEHIAEHAAEPPDGASPGAAGGAAGGPGPDERLRLCELAIRAYLRALADELPYARLFLVEVYAAGPEAIRDRGRLQETISDALADLTGGGDETARFACRMIVAATSAMVTPPVAENDRDALLALGEPLIAHIRVLWNAGIIGTVPAPAAT